jgi:putative membrane protein
MRLHVRIGITVGLVIVTLLLTQNDNQQILRAVTGAGWGLGLLLLIHPVQTFLAGSGWRCLVRGEGVPGWLDFTGLRWIRESVNGLLPVAQMGGNLVGARLLSGGGVALSEAGAATAVDLTMETVTQLIFTLIGVALLVLGPYDPTVTRLLAAATGIAVLVVVAFVVAQWRGLFGLLERALLRLSKKPYWAGLGDVAGLHAAIISLYADRPRLARSVITHLLSWLIGGVEVVVALRLVGISVDLRQGILIESIGQAMRTAGFAIPGSLGVQEGGFILICGLLGIGPEGALELALLKRIRELALGLPGLVYWQYCESRHSAGLAAQHNPAPEAR